MAHRASPTPFIKEEQDDFTNDNRFFTNSNGFSMSHQYNQGFGSSQNSSVDPSQLTMAGLQRGFGSQQNLSSNFISGYSSINDDELADLVLDSNGAAGASGYVDLNNFNQSRNFNQSYFNGAASAPVRASHQSHISQPYSNTPEGGPIQSPFLNGGFNYSQFQPGPTQQHSFGHQRGPSFDAHNGLIDMNTQARSDVKRIDRGSTNSRSPMTPHLGAVPISTESGIRPQPIQTGHMNHHHRQMSQSTAWDGTPGSGHSYVESPLSSPPMNLTNPQISEVIRSGKHASLPAKVGGLPHSAPGPTVQSQEAKKKRRRESHNLVERRRRDNINERIQELSHLVPSHRLDDEKIRKHLQHNTPLSPGVGGSMSPPHNTSLLSGSTGRRTAGNITQGLPIEDKDKGPNKGDILNGAVSWTRDLMWMLHRKLQQESELLDIISSFGGVTPFEVTEDEKRMRTELMDAIARNNASDFEYSRGPESGLCVPKHTTINGDPLPVHDPHGHMSVHQGGGNVGDQLYNQSYWTHTDMNPVHNNDADTFKEEDEYDMDMS